MKKVLIVTHVSGFVPQFEMNNVRYLQKKGYQVHYAANFEMISYGNDNQRLKGSGIICHHIPFLRSPFHLRNLTSYRLLKRLIEQEGFQLIHCHTPMGGAVARLAGRKARKKGTKIIYTVHGFHFFKGAPLINWICYYPAERFLSRYTDVQITVNEEDYQRACGFRAKKVVKIPGIGVDTAGLLAAAVDNRTEFRSRLGLKPADFVLLSVGELVVNKNHQAVLQVVADMGRPEVKYLLCGQGACEAELRAMAARLQIEDQVIFLGYRKDVAKIYEAADLFVFPSYREGLSVALMEAMAKGLPVAATRIRGNTDLIQDRQGGLLVSPGNVKELGLAVIKLMHDPKLCKQMGSYNQTAVKQYDQTQTAAVMTAVYDGELGEL